MIRPLSRLHREELDEQRIGFWAGRSRAGTSMMSIAGIPGGAVEGRAARRRCRLVCEVMERRLLLSTYVVTSTERRRPTARHAALGDPPGQRRHPAGYDSVRHPRRRRPVDPVVDSASRHHEFRRDRRDDPAELPGISADPDRWLRARRRQQRAGHLGGRQHDSRAGDRRVFRFGDRLELPRRQRRSQANYLGVNASGTEAEPQRDRDLDHRLVEQHDRRSRPRRRT